MTLKRVLETLDGLDEALKPLYKEQNGKYLLQVDDAVELKTSLEAARKEADALKEKLKAKDADAKSKEVDFEEYHKLKEEALQREVNDAKKRGDYEALEAQLKQRHKEEVESLNKKYRALEKDIEERRRRHEGSFLESELTKAIAEAKGKHKPLIPALAKHVMAEEKDGELRLVVLGPDGKPRLKDGAGTPFLLSDLMAEFKADEDYGACFEGSGASGAGSPPPMGAANAATAKQARFNELQARSKELAAKGLSLPQAERSEVMRLGNELWMAGPQAQQTTATA